MSEQETEAVEETTEETTTAEAETPKPESKGRDAAIAAERRKARAAEKRAEEAERKLAETARKEAEAEGRWQEIAEEERKRAESLEARIAEREQRDSITDAARRLRFKNPDLAYRLLSTEERTDPEPALKRLLKDEPYLQADPPERTGAQVGASTTTEDPMVRAGKGVLDAIERVRGRA